MVPAVKLACLVDGYLALFPGPEWFFGASLIYALSLSNSVWNTLKNSVSLTFSCELLKISKT